MQGTLGGYYLCSESVIISDHNHMQCPKDHHETKPQTVKYTRDFVLQPIVLRLNPIRGYCRYTVIDAESEIIWWWHAGSHYGPSSHGDDCAGGSHAEAARENPQHSCSAAGELVPRSNLTIADKSPSDSESRSLVRMLLIFVSSDVVPSAIIFPLCMHSVALYCTQPV